jgi:hypothetical protein
MQKECAVGGAKSSFSFDLKRHSEIHAKFA